MYDRFTPLCKLDEHYYHLINGLISGYPLCCVLHFAGITDLRAKHRENCDKAWNDYRARKITSKEMEDIYEDRDGFNQFDNFERDRALCPDCLARRMEEYIRSKENGSKKVESQKQENN